MPSNVDILMEMGFDKNKVMKALAKTNHKGVEAAMDWLFNHADDPDIDEPLEAPVDNVLSSPQQGVPSDDSGMQSEEAATAAVPESSEEMGEIVNSIKCDDCGKLLKTQEAAGNHASRTGHQNFSQCTEELKPLTAEEKAEKLKQLQDKMAAKRARRTEQEKKDQLDKEIQRRLLGKDITTAKFEHEQREMKLIADAKKREKQADQLAKQKILDQIKADKEARAAQAAEAKREREGKPAVKLPQAAASPTVQTSAPVEKKEYTDCRLQIRLPSGTPLTHTFSANEPLSAVKLYVTLNSSLTQDNPGKNFNFVTTFPRKVYDDDDLEKPLKVLGLVPSAVVMVQLN